MYRPGPEALMFRTKWLSDNRVIGGIIAVLVIVNAFAIVNGYYR